MSVLMVFRIALKALGRNKMRTALTMLGMIIGVAAVITMVALGTGAQTSIEAQIQSTGTNMIIVSAGNFSTGRRSLRVRVTPARSHRTMQSRSLIPTACSTRRRASTRAGS